MATLIRAIAFADGSPCPVAGKFLSAFDADFGNGRGWADYTDDPGKAIHFADNGDAFEFWRTQSRAQPLRPDGKPNRPLTSTTIELVKVE